MHRLTLLAAAFALAAAPAIPTLAWQDLPQAEAPVRQPEEPQRRLPQPGEAPQEQGQQGQPQQGQLNPQLQGEQPMDDQLFVAAAAAAGMAEVGISQLALQKTEDEQVRRFAQQMIEDHTEANQQLMELAQSKSLQLPQGPDLKDTASAMALAGCAPEAFAGEFFKQQEAAHILAVGLFKAEAERGQDEELRDFARTLLPKLEEHLQMARQHAGAHGQAAPAAEAQPGLAP